MCSISLVVQWLRLCVSNAWDVGLILAQGTRIPFAMRCEKKKKKKNSLCKEDKIVKMSE